MNLFSEKEITQAKEQALRDELKKHGLGHLRIRITHSHGGRDEIALDGGTDHEIKRAIVALGGKESDLSGMEPVIDLTGRFSSELKVDTSPKLKL